ncbi:Dyp-type peroxidase [Conexibacter arvalis]|uniref:Deferrochelatase/peroxidase EfeB n=1 Tax=Conexibacter arvalis TaxID=912552 RepID=A0A840IJW0_9ACTN|nr:deferrochelatase/peroxidase EfeB [Conexibacter arvalis]
MRAPRVSRREALAGVAVGALAGGGAIHFAGGARSEARPPARPFDGARQAGIATPPQAHLTLAAFDLHTPDRADVPRLLRDWTALIVALCGGARDGAADAGVGAASTGHDTGERAGLDGAGLTITVGFGASLFDDRYGFAQRRPAGLATPLPGEAALDRARGGGDLLLQVRGEDRQVVFHAVHQLTNAALGIARRRWTQHGFLSRPAAGGTPRNLFGFKDGTVNPAPDDAAALVRHVWLPAGGPLAGGTYLVYRRVRMRMQAWDRSPLDVQERAIGRRKASGGPLTGGGETTPLALAAAPPRSHVRLAHPDANDGARILRRAYNYDDGATADGEQDAGMAFVCFAADPARQVAPMLARMLRDDELHRYLVHTAGGIYAVPPAPGRGEHIGEELLS